MTNKLTFQIEPFEFDTTQSFESEVADESWQGEVSQSNQEFVRWVQRALNQILGLRLALDGMMGPATRSTIRSFQQKRGLVVDGIVGSKTTAALKASMTLAPPASLGSGTVTSQIDRCVAVGVLGPDFRRKPTNPRGSAQSLTSSPDSRDMLLFDFDIDDDTLKPAHTTTLDDLLKFMAEDFDKRKGPKKRWTIHIDGRASRTGTSGHNKVLSQNRAAQVQRYLCFHLFDHVRATDQLEFESSVDFNTEFNGFEKAIEAGESPRERSVRVAITRPGITPPPLQIFPSCSFRPSIHGFKFDNGFNLPAAITRALSRPPISTILSPLGVSIGRSGYGLCGGMVTLARDHFRFGVPIPPVTSEPPIGSALYNSLVDRQLDSLNLNLASAGPSFGKPILKFAEWMKLPDRGSGSVAELTAREFAIVRASLAHSGMRILGLVLTKAPTGLLTNNHQVLALCLTQRSTDEFAIHIYDPNFHDCDDITLEVKLAGREASVTYMNPTCPTNGLRIRAVRGFFVMPYRPVKP